MGPSKKMKCPACGEKFELESGLEVGDFIFLQDSDGLEETINTATESTTIPGRYTLAATAFAKR